MHRRQYARKLLRFNRLTALLRYFKLASKQCLGRCRSHTNNQRWLDCRDFSIKPWAARRYFPRVRFFVNAPFPARFPLEVFDCIRHVHFIAVNPSFFQTSIQQPSRWPYKWKSFNIFAVTRLFTYQQQLCLNFTCTKNSLRSMLI